MKDKKSWFSQRTQRTQRGGTLLKTEKRGRGISGMVPAQNDREIPMV